jgi:hypothetical protein
MRRQARLNRAVSPSAWPYRLRIAGGSRAPTAEVVEEFGAGALCTKCLATRLRLTLYSIEHGVGELRREFVIDTIAPCLECGSRKTITLRGLNEGIIGAAKSGALVISKTRTAPATFRVTFVPYFNLPHLARKRTSSVTPSAIDWFVHGEASAVGGCGTHKTRTKTKGAADDRALSPC